MDNNEETSNFENNIDQVVKSNEKNNDLVN
jgi:hypothetical protein